MLRFLFILFISLTSVFAAPRDELELILDRFQTEQGIVRRMDEMSRIFLGYSYGPGGPLGEGANGRFDQDPLYRFDTFDCTTFVETIIALALSRSAQDFENHLDSIRYEDGIVDYLKRNHFTDLQWIPNNVRNGYLKEINELVAPANKIKTAKALINFGGWLRSHKLEQIQVPEASRERRLSLLEELHAQASYYSPVTAEVPYIEISYLLKNPKLLERIPSGAVVNFVRPNWDLTDVAGTHQNISHQGLLFAKGRTLYLRHASTTGKVEELPLIDYLKRFTTHPTLKGIHLMLIQEVL